MIHLKEATLDDIPTIQELSKKLFLHHYDALDKTLYCDWPYGEEGIKFYTDKIVDKDKLVLLAYDDENIIGYVTAFTKDVEKHRTTGKHTELSDMFVEESYRSKGVGTQLINYFFEWSKKLGAELLSVRAHPGNTSTINFYEGHDFVKQSIIFEKIL